jgi:hypothetical protein
MLLRTKLLTGLLVATVGLWGYSVFDTHAAETRLYEIAGDKMKELQGAPGEMRYEMTPVTVTHRDYVIFGKARGKVTIFLRPTAAEPGQESSHEDRVNGAVAGVEYIVEKKGADWIVVESSRCSSDQCRTEGSKAFGNPKLLMTP